MDKSAFLKIVKQYPDCSADDARVLFDLKKQYPYSQVLHTLSSRVSKDHNLANQQQELQQAAIYTADRSVLKDIMTRRDVIAPSFEPAKAPATTVAPEQKEIEDTIDGVDLADTVLADLQKLNTLKHNFEMLFADHTKVSIPVTEVKKSREIKSKEPEPIQEAQISKPQDETKPAKPQGSKSTKSKRERIIELAKQVNAAKPSVEVPASQKKKKDNPDHIIEEIQVTKEVLEPESEKQKEQLEIIDHFIKSQPSITSARERNVPPVGDLNPVKSGDFGENIVSETLVEILIKQGKKDRAIEVLKKLIWKYPQKKAYFASQIEELKK